VTPAAGGRRKAETKRETERGGTRDRGGPPVEVKIGVQNANKELVVDSELSTDEVETIVSKSISGDERVLVLVDAKGRKVVVPTDKLAYVEIGSPTIGQVGFRS
jgi:hypothetical protein